MLGKIDKRQAQSFVSLNHNGDWSVVEDWLIGEISSLQDKLSTEPDEIICRQLQGAVQVLRDLLKKKSQARTILEKF